LKTEEISKHPETKHTEQKQTRKEISPSHTSETDEEKNEYEQEEEPISKITERLEVPLKVSKSTKQCPNDDSKTVDAKTNKQTSEHVSKKREQFKDTDDETDSDITPSVEEPKQEAAAVDKPKTTSKVETQKVETTKDSSESSSAESSKSTDSSRKSSISESSSKELSEVSAIKTTFSSHYFSNNIYLSLDIGKTFLNPMILFSSFPSWKTFMFTDKLK
jgi:hypothetical protein